MSMTPQQDRFIGWLLTAKEQREPSAQKDLAEELGLSPTKLTSWKADPEFLSAWNVMYLKTIGSPETKMAIMNTLLTTATDEDDPKHVAAAKTFFEIEGSLRPVKNQVDIKVASMPPSELTTDQLNELMASKAGDELAKRRDVG